MIKKMEREPPSVIILITFAIDLMFLPLPTDLYNLYFQGCPLVN